jgi:hypothetical protein
MHRFRSGTARTSASISAMSTPSVTTKGISPSEGRHQEGLSQEVRQLSNIGSNACRALVAGEELGRRAPPRLVLEIDVGESFCSFSSSPTESAFPTTPFGQVRDKLDVNFQDSDTSSTAES